MRYFDSRKIEEWSELLIRCRFVCDAGFEHEYAGAPAVDTQTLIELFAAITHVHQEIGQLPDKLMKVLSYTTVWPLLLIISTCSKSIDTDAFVRRVSDILTSAGRRSSELSSSGTCNDEGGCKGNGQNLTFPPEEHLTAAEQAIVDLLAKVGAVKIEALEDASLPTGAFLANKALNRDYDGNVKGMLSSLRKRRLIDNGRYHGRGSGYFLTTRGVKLAQCGAKSVPGRD